MEKVSFKYLLFLLPIFFVGCSAIQKLTQSSPKHLNWEQTVQLAPSFQSMEWKNAKAEIEFGSQKFNSPIQAKFMVDSAIHLSATPFFGMEMFKVELQKTSISVYDKINKKTYEVDFNLIDSLSGNSFIFDNLQDLLSNRPFIYAPAPKVKMKKTLRNDSVFWSVDRKTTNQTISLDKKGRMIEALIQPNNADRMIKVIYSKFEKWDNKLYPEQIDIQIHNKSIQLRLSLSLHKIIFNNQLNLRYEQPENYIRVPISTLL